MNDEAANGSAGSPDGRGHPGGGAGEHSPLQARAAFIKDRSWEFVVRFNRGTCERGGAQHGPNRETHETVAAEWRAKQPAVVSLAETLDFLRQCHRRAPFLFFNGNTFAEIGRQLAAALFAELPAARRREATSAIAHYIAGVLDREAMADIVEALCESAQLQAGDRVKTLRGSTHGVIQRVLEDGRVVWQADGSRLELTALPESLLRETKP